MMGMLLAESAESLAHGYAAYGYDFPFSGDRLAIFEKTGVDNWEKTW